MNPGICGKLLPRRSIDGPFNGSRVALGLSLVRSNFVVIGGDGKQWTTANLWVKGLESGEKVDYTLWFSDVYVRTSTGWKYVFGQCGQYVAAAESNQKLRQ